MSAGHSVPASSSRTAPVDLEVRTRNLLLGALVGAIVMLLALPTSRPFYLNALVPSSLDRSLDQAATYTNGSRLGDVRSLDGRGLWFRVAADRMARQGDLSPQELATVEAIVARAAKEEPENAYWTQADAALLEKLGQYDEAVQVWIGGSRRLHWSDHQNTLLGGILTNQVEPAYAFARLYYLRSDAPERVIAATGRHLMDRYWSDPKVSLPLRLATILNGDLMRKNARSIACLRNGVDLVEAPIAKPTDEPDPSAHHVLLARLDLAKTIEAAKLGYDAADIERIFLEAESATALTTTDDASQAMRNIAAQAALAQVLPGAFLVCSLLCAVAALAWQGYRLIRRLDDRKHWAGTVVAAILGGLVAAATSSIYVALALAFCVIFSGSTPKNVRKRRPTWLGPLFSLTMTSIAVVIVIAWAGGVAFYSSPGRALLAPLFPSQFDAVALVCGIVALAVGFLFLCAPLWAFAQRLPTGFVLEVGLRQLVAKVALTALSFAVLLGPICAYWNTQLIDQARERFTNEPDRYYTDIKSHDAHPGS